MLRLYKASLGGAYESECGECAGVVAACVGDGGVSRGKGAARGAGIVCDVSDWRGDTGTGEVGRAHGGFVRLGAVDREGEAGLERVGAVALESGSGAVLRID